MSIFNKVTKTFQWGDKTVIMETGEIARQASGAVLVNIDDTVVLATVVASKSAKPGQDFFPLTVDYIEKTYAAGKIPGSFFKREAKPSEHETLTSRLIDRPIRPLFPEGFFNEVHVVIHTVSLNPEVDADIAALIATSAALAISGIPFNGPIGAARVGYINGEYVLNPGQTARKNSQMDLVVAGTEAAVLMVESEAQQLSEEIMLGAVVFGHEQGNVAINAIHELVRDAGKPVWQWEAPAKDEALIAKVVALADDKLRAAYQIRNKQARTQACREAYAAVMAALKADGVEFDAVKVEGMLFDIEAGIVRSQILAGEPRIDGRDTRTVRPIEIRNSVLPRAHGSALFTRGETQALVVTTLGTERDAQRIDALCITLGAQRGHNQRLGFATREQGRAVGTGQHAVADLDGAHGARIAAVDAGLASQDLAAHDARFDVEQHAFNLDGVELNTIGLQRCHHGCIGFAACLRAGLLVADLVGSAQLVVGQCHHLGDQGFVLGRRFPLPHGLARVAHQFVNGVDGHIALLVTEHHGTQHDFFGQLLGFGFDHQHCGFGTRHHQIHLRVLARSLARVEHVLAVDITHACGTNGAVERNARDGQGSTGSDQRSDVGIHFRVQRHRVDHHVHFVEETFGEQRTDRAVDQAAGQGFVLAGLGFALEEAARDLAGRIRLLDVVHRQGKEVLAGLGGLGGDHSGQHHGVVNIHQHGARGLAGDFAGFHDDGLVTPLEGLGDFVENAHVQLLF